MRHHRQRIQLILLCIQYISTFFAKVAARSESPIRGHRQCTIPLHWCRGLQHREFHMAFYEHTVISRPDISPSQVEELVEELSKFVSERDGKVKRVEYWGLRTLAYPINKLHKAHYSLLYITAPPKAIHELERRHRISDDVIRYMSVRVEKLSKDLSPLAARRERTAKD